MRTYKDNYGELAWRDLLWTIRDYGLPVSPRGQPTREVLHTNYLQVAMDQAVVTSPLRKLNYQFMAAEALWVLSGSTELAPLTRFVKRMADFSDDGLNLAGAYGPPITEQLPYVVRTLVKDPDTRQACLSIWRPSPAASKDIPCTVAMVFSIRKQKLHQHVFMRSSDAWLGIPYDMFTFSCVGLKVACEVNRLRLVNLAPPIEPGNLTIAATSSHLYDRDGANVDAVLHAEAGPAVYPAPRQAILAGDWATLDASIFCLREGLTVEAGMWDLRMGAINE